MFKNERKHRRSISSDNIPKQKENKNKHNKTVATIKLNTQIMNAQISAVSPISPKHDNNQELLSNCGKKDIHKLTIIITFFKLVEQVIFLIYILSEK